MRCLHHIALSMALRSMWKRRWKYCLNQRWWAILRKYHFFHNRADALRNLENLYSIYKTPQKQARQIPAWKLLQIVGTKTYPDQDSIHHLQLLGDEKPFSVIWVHWVCVCISTKSIEDFMYRSSWPI